VKATEIARSMVTRFAMEPKLGHAVYDSEPQSFLGPVPAGLHSRSYSEETARQIDHAIREILERAYQRARAVLEQNRSVLDEGAKLLLEKETLDEGEMRTLFSSLGGETPLELAPLA